MKMTMKQALAATLLLALASIGTAQAQIDVDVDIDVGSITILYALSDISVNIDDTALGQLFTPAGCTAATVGTDCDEGAASGNATVNSGALEFAGGITPGALANVNAVPLTLQNVWAVRAIGGTSTNTTVAAAISGANSTLTGPNSSQIVVSGLSVPGGTIADPGLGTPTSGNVTMSLDLSGVTSDGVHDGGALLYTIEVTGT